jgi:hypothetical protein
VPDGVDLDKVDASFKKGVLTVTLPKTAEAHKAFQRKVTAWYGINLGLGKGLPMSALGSLADMTPANFDVRFTRKSGHPSPSSRCQLWGTSRHGPVSFDYLIGDLVAPCRIDPGIPSNRDAEGERESCC